MSVNVLLEVYGSNTATTISTRPTKSKVKPKSVAKDPDLEAFNSITNFTFANLLLINSLVGQEERLQSHRRGPLARFNVDC